MQKHTPGPWHIGMKPGPMLYGSRGEQVADMTAKLLPDGETIANARLIAAAPELLAALLDVIGLAERGAKAGNGPEMTELWMRGQIANARAVIAKLEG